MDVDEAFLNGDSVVLLGDFNAKLGFEVINHEMNPMYKNGEKLLNLFCKYNFIEYFRFMRWDTHSDS